MVSPERREFLRSVVLSIGNLAAKVLSGTEQGSVVTLAMAVDALLSADADDVCFLMLREKFDGLPTQSVELTTLYNSVLSVCDLAVRYEDTKAEEIVTSLLTLSPAPTSGSWN